MRQTKLLNQVINTSRKIPLRELLSIKEYPRNMQDVLTLYAEGYSLADYLVQKKGEHGRAAFLSFLADALKTDSLQQWEKAFQKHYGMSSLQEVEHEWTGWVMAGSPPLTSPDGTLLADSDADGSRNELANQTEIRGQSPDAAAAVSVMANPNPLPRLSRPRRDRTSGSDLSAPQPGSLTAATSEQNEWEGLPAGTDPNQPISVHPARPASDPPPRWQFPWQRRAEPSESTPGLGGFSNPRSSETASQPAFDFGR